MIENLLESTGKLKEQIEHLRQEMEDINKCVLDSIATTLEGFRIPVEQLQKERKILESLFFDEMNQRYHAISEAHTKTFFWIFGPDRFDRSDPRSMVAFKQWLQSGKGIFWVSGKPGSGKSTLMKYLYTCGLTKEYLRYWAKDDTLIILASFFWMGGTIMQRSQRGLLQQLLFQILRDCPDLTSFLCSKRFHGGWHDLLQDWTLSQLLDAFERLKTVTGIAKICLFIDGLDEYGGDGDDHLDLINTLQGISRAPHVKLCLSSRRWPCFEDAFGTDNLRKLYLEDLTMEDIAQFATDKLRDVPGYSQLISREQDRNIVSEITLKAQGVFLWVYFVVRALRGMLMNGEDRIDVLQERIQAFPSDLEKFFDKLLGSVDEVYQKRMAITFQVAIQAPEPLTLTVYWFLEKDVATELSTSTIPQIDQIEDRISRRLSGPYKGLLEARGQRGIQIATFLHRTVRDYLLDSRVYDRFLRTKSNANFEACRALAANMRFFHHKREDHLALYNYSTCCTDRVPTRLTHRVRVYAFGVPTRLRVRCTPEAVTNQGEVR